MKGDAHPLHGKVKMAALLRALDAAAPGLVTYRVLYAVLWPGQAPPRRALEQTDFYARALTRQLGVGVVKHCGLGHSRCPARDVGLKIGVYKPAAARYSDRVETEGIRT